MRFNMDYPGNISIIKICSTHISLLIGKKHYVKMTFISDNIAPKKIRKLVSPSNNIGWHVACTIQMMSSDFAPEIREFQTHETITILSKLSEQCPELKTWVDAKLKMVSTFSPKIGICVMENLKGYKSVEELITTTKKREKQELFAAIYAYIHIKCAVEYDIIHGDYSGRNVLINLGDREYFHGVPGSGRPKLINFAKAKQSSQTDIMAIQFMIKDEKYMDIILLFNSMETQPSETLQFIINEVSAEKLKIGLNYLFNLRRNIRRRNARRAN